MAAALRTRSASVNADMNTDPQAIRAQVDAILADLPHIGPSGNDDAADSAAVDDSGAVDDLGAVDAVGRRLEEAHQILVDALESVEKG